MTNRIGFLQLSEKPPAFANLYEAVRAAQNDELAVEIPFVKDNDNVPFVGVFVFELVHKNVAEFCVSVDYMFSTDLIPFTNHSPFSPLPREYLKQHSYPKTESTNKHMIELIITIPFDEMEKLALADNVRDHSRKRCFFRFGFTMEPERNKIKAATYKHIGTDTFTIDCFMKGNYGIVQSTLTHLFNANPVPVRCEENVNNNVWHYKALKFKNVSLLRKASEVKSSVFDEEFHQMSGGFYDQGLLERKFTFFSKSCREQLSGLYFCDMCFALDVQPALERIMGSIKI